MKTKEIHGWIYGGQTNLNETIPDNFHEMRNVFKAKLVIEQPEKKIEITESDIDRAVQNFNYSHADRMNQKDLIEYLKLELFGKP